jgi:serine/threonine-protein kinase
LQYLSENYDECIKLGENYINTTPFIISTKEDDELFGDIYYIVGNSYYETEDYSNAKILFENALEHNTSNGLYYRDYAVTLAKLGQVEEAQKQLDKAIKLGIAQDSVYMAQGEIAHMKGQYDEAIQYLSQAIETTEDKQMKKRAIFICVDVYKSIGDDAIDNEIELLEKNVNQFSGNGNLVMSEYLADAYARKAKTDEATSDLYYEKALSIFKSIYESGYVTYQIQENIAIIYESLGNFEEAQNLLLQMAEDYPKRYEPYKRLAFLEADIQQTKENADRSYKQMQEYYNKAKELYSEKEQDMEMDMLDNMMQELRDGGWL